MTVFARSLSQKGRASAPRLLAPDQRVDSFLRKVPETLPIPPASPGLLKDPVRGEEKRLPVTPRLGLCLAALQSQHRPALRKAWGHLSYATASELATISMSLWGSSSNHGVEPYGGSPEAKASWCPSSLEEPSVPCP